MIPGAEAELLGILEKFCDGIARRDVEAVMGLELDPDVVVITSEDPLLRGVAELRRFLDAYVEGETTYSWDWHRCDVSIAGSVGWLIAEGTELAATNGRQDRHPYRMTMVAERQGDAWVLRQIHGSSPH
jgi:ketosteroid isomerase-like protein